MPKKLPSVFALQVRYSEVAKRRQELIDKEEWTLIFKYPHVSRLSFFCRLKVYQTVATLLICPSCILGEYLNVLSSDISTIAVLSSVTACLLMLAIGNLAERTVGALYLNESRAKLRVAHLTFFGHREDDILKTDDVAQFSDVGEKWDDIIIKVHRYDLPKYPYYITLRHGGIVDRDLFQRVFGTDDRFPA